MPQRQPAVQSCQDLHSRPGIAWAFRTWQQLEGVPLEPHRVVPGHSPAVLEAQDLLPGTVPGPEAGMQAQGVAGEPRIAG